MSEPISGASSPPDAQRMKMMTESGISIEGTVDRQGFYELHIAFHSLSKDKATLAVSRFIARIDEEYKP